MGIDSVDNIHIQDTDENTPMNYYQPDIGPNCIQALDIISHFRATCQTLNKERIGLQSSKIGTCSTRKSFAMPFHLVGIREASNT